MLFVGELLGGGVVVGVFVFCVEFLLVFCFRLFLLSCLYLFLCLLLC